MRYRLLSLLFNIYIRILRFRKRIALGFNVSPSALILPPSNPGSLGDEAMVIATIEYLKEQGIRRIGLISYRPTAPWQYSNPTTENIESYRFFKGDSWKAKFHISLAMSQYEQLYCLGGDVMDGKYSETRSLQRIKLLDLATKVGTRAAVLGFSFNAQPTPTSVQAFRNLPLDVKICARDPISWKRLSYHLERPVELVADLAFLLQPVASGVTSTALQWSCQQRAEGRIIIGINANHHNLPGHEVNKLDKLVQIYTNTLIELYSKNIKLSFMLIPHDSRGKLSDVLVAEAIFESLPPEIQPHCTKVPISCSSAAEIKYICGDLDIVLSGRMHLAIGCLSQGTPVACITYQDKMEGLFRHFKLAGMTINPERAFQPNNLADFFIPLVEKREEIRQHICSRLPQIKQLARANFR